MSTHAALAFQPVFYRYGKRIERFFNTIKHVLAMAARYNKRDDSFSASIRIWLQFNEAVT